MSETAAAVQQRVQAELVGSAVSGAVFAARGTAAAAAGSVEGAGGWAAWTSAAAGGNRRQCSTTAAAAEHRWGAVWTGLGRTEATVTVVAGLLAVTSDGCCKAVTTT